MRKSFKYRIFPTKLQRTALQNNLDACRWVYNKTLEVRRDAYQNAGDSLSRYDTVKMLPAWKAESEWLKSGHAQAMQDAQTRVDLAFRAFFRRVKNGEKPGYPRFKSYHRYDSFTYPQEKGNWRFLDNGKLRMSKIGDVKIKLHRPLEGKVKTMTVTRDRLDKWYVCFSCVVDPTPRPPTDKVVGIDLGLTTFATMSNGDKITRQRWMKQDEKDLKRVQRKVSRLPKGSSERRKAVCALNHIHVRIANRRKDFAHKEARKLVDMYQFIAFEDLDILDMQSLGNKTINKGVADVAWRQFVECCSSKAAEAGRTVVLVDPRNTTKECSSCGEIVPKDLRVRIHECPHCGLILDRDENAALNILGRGLATLDSDS